MAGETQAVGLGGQPRSVCCACIVGLQTHVFFLLLFFFSSFSSFSFLPSLDENQLWEGLYFFVQFFFFM
jgi:hypothetical protein